LRDQTWLNATTILLATRGKSAVTIVSAKKLTLNTFDRTGTLSFTCFGKKAATQLAGCPKDLVLD